jgi:hypothetical protein
MTATTAATFLPRSRSDRVPVHFDRWAIMGALILGASGMIAGLLIALVISLAFGPLPVMVWFLIVGVETIVGLFVAGLMQAAGTRQAQDLEPTAVYRAPAALNAGASR